MSEKELGKALLGLDATSPDARQLTQKILKRDRRRVRLLTGLAIIFWTIAATGILLVLYAFPSLYPKQKQFIRDVGQGHLTAAERDRIEQVHWMVVEKATVVVACSVAILALAALSTVLLVLASRGATLRQVNVCLIAAHVNRPGFAAEPPCHFRTEASWNPAR